jgi:hypothetical protein
MTYINTQTGEIVNLVQYRTNQRRAAARTRTYKQSRQDAHFPKAMWTLALLGTFAIVLSFWATAIH